VYILREIKRFPPAADLAPEFRARERGKMSNFRTPDPHPVFVLKAT
jgi:hypothetical protein